MKKLIIINLSLALLLVMPASAQMRIKIGVYEGLGAAPTCVMETKAACGMDKSAEVSSITSSDIAKGALRNIDVMIIPGGGGSTEFLSMGTANRDSITQFVERGGGIIGICAGAYLLSNTPNYSCLSMSGGEAVDLEHDNRGRGVVKVTLNTLGKEYFPQLAKKDTLYMMYYEGPAIVPATNAKEKYHDLGTMQSDVHVEGDAPENMTNGKPFFFVTPYGRGIVFSIVGHPEATPGMQWMLPSIVRMVAPAREYMPMEVEKKFVKPNLFTKEMLMTEANRKHENELFKQLLYGTDDEKVQAVKWLGENLSWSGKQWVRGLLYDKSPAVRKAAAEFAEKYMYRYYLKDLEAALMNEQDANVRQTFEKAIEQLR